MQNDLTPFDARPIRRRKLDRPTFIYWLIDVRPAILTGGWSSGQPFYCGKTVKHPDRRLAEHKIQAKRHLNRPVSQRIIECGEDIIVKIVETVPFNLDWQEREKDWIKILRLNFAGSCNVCDGGSGIPGLVFTEASRAKMRAAKVFVSPETRRKIGLKSIGRKITPEGIERLRKSNLNREFSAEQKAQISAKISAAKKGKPHIISESGLARVRAAAKNRIVSPETRAKLSRAKRGQIISAEQRIKISSTLSGHEVSESTREKIRIANKGRKLSESHKDKLRIANKGKTLSEDHKQKIRMAHLKRGAKNA